MKKYLLTLVTLLFSTLCMKGQDIVVTVAPVQQVLPPQALMYVANAGKYFNVTLTNVSGQSQQIYLGMSLERVMPHYMDALSTPHGIQPSTPITIAPNATIHLNMLDLKHSFSHLSSRSISVASDIFSGYASGSYGLLPEGQYRVKITAYKWASPKLAYPVVLSNASSGTATFFVSYKAQAPEFLTPVLTSLNKDDIAEVDALNAQFTWKESIVTGFPRQVRYAYTLKVVEVLKGQPKDYAMEHNPAVYLRRNILAPLCVIPPHYIGNRLEEGKLYAAQVTATSKSHGALDFVMVENDGKSDIRLFRIVSTKERTVEPDDTLADNELLAAAGLPAEALDAKEASLEDLRMMVEDNMYAALDAEILARANDSIAKSKFDDILRIMGSIKNMPYPAAKKDGHTQDTKDAYKEIESCAEHIRQSADDAAAAYANAYKAFKAIQEERGRLKKEADGNELGEATDECVTAVSKAKHAALECKARYEAVKITEMMAKKRISSLNKLE